MLNDITSEHVLKALEEFDKVGLDNSHRDAQAYDLVYKGKEYPPKYIISIAHKYTPHANELTPSAFDSGHANRHLRGLGFSIKERPQKSLLTAAQVADRFSWVPFYEEMCSKLGDYSPGDLIGFLKDLNVDGLKDRDGKGNEFYLTDIDPFTFVSFLNKFGDEKRIQILRKVKKLLNLSTTTPAGTWGLPTAQAQSVWLFGYRYKRQPDDIEQLRILYRQVQSETVTADQFKKVLGIYQVGKSKLTEALFYQKPKLFFPINAKTKPYLKELGLSYQWESYEDYLHLLSEIRKINPLPFFEIASKWLREAQVSTLFYCVGTVYKEQGDQLQRFLKEGIWENGYGNSDEQYSRIVREISPGAKLAAKSAFVRNRTDSILQIKAVGTVISNPRNGINIEVEWESDFEPFELIGKGSYRDTIQEVTKREDIKLIFNHQYEDVELASFPVINHPNNSILYGPPGTGKTYETIDMAVEIADGSKSPNHQLNKQRFDALLGDQIEFITFHQNYSYEDFVMGLKPDLDDTGTGLKFRQHEGIFYQIAKRARLNYEASQTGSASVGQRPFEEVLAELARPLIENDQEVEITMSSGLGFVLTDLGERSIDFRKPNGSTLHTLSIATLKRIYDGVQNVSPNGLRSYYKPLSDRLKELGRTAQPKSSLKRYVLIIDEINRANMSRVFGELITLLEDDKRLGGENEIRLTLPSGERFAVPPNLYLIGTMNTADKSLALLDIALRRRFEFIGKYPRYDVDGLDEDVANLLRRLNEVIHKHKHSADFLIGHAYFIGKQKGSLQSVFQNRVIPLLLEYFSGRTDLVENLLREADIATTKNPFTFQLEVVDGI